MKKFLSILLTTVLLLSTFSTAIGFAEDKDVSPTVNPKAQTIAVVPLDSRPCNTQYPQLIGGIMNQNILLPPKEILDNFTTPSNTELLWKWMEEVAPNSSKMIIFTNQLFNGGLISSRSYTTLGLIDSQVQRLVSFIEEHPKLEISVVSILPRLLPNQYDLAFKGHSASLSKWGEQADYNKVMGLPGPTYPENVPKWVADRYKAVFEYHYQLVKTLGELANTGKISKLVIGQDDGEQFAPSNIIFREIQQLPLKNVFMQKGADEITMMLLAAFEAPKDLEVNLVYTNPTKAGEYLPFESAPLSQIMVEKLNFFGISENPLAKDKIIVHNDANASSLVSSFVPALKTGFVGIADVSYTNKGDTALKDYLFTKGSLTNIDSYAGWNTGTNSIGTVVSQYVATKVLENKIPQLTPEEINNSIENLMKFKYIRLNEDIIYQGLMYSSMNNVYKSRKLVNSNGEILANHSQAAQNLLNEYSQKYRIQLDSVFQGNNFIYVGDKLYETHYKAINAVYTFPWNRTFEIQVYPLFIKN